MERASGSPSRTSSEQTVFESNSVSNHSIDMKNLYAKYIYKLNAHLHWQTKKDLNKSLKAAPLYINNFLTLFSSIAALHDYTSPEIKQSQREYIKRFEVHINSILEKQCKLLKIALKKCLLIIDDKEVVRCSSIRSFDVISTQ